MNTQSNGVHVYIGLDREGRIVEFVRMDGDKEITKYFTDCTLEDADKTEPVVVPASLGKDQFELRRKKSTADGGNGSGQAASAQNTEGREAPTGGPSGAPAGDPGGDPCCVRLASGQIFCFC